jgi:hypothetical protein
MSIVEISYAALICFAIIGVGELVSYFTKAFFPSMAAALFIYLVLTWVGMPKDYVSIAGFEYIGEFAMLIFIVHLGTSVLPSDYIKNVKSIIIALAALAGGLLCVVGIGGLIFGFDTMLAGASAACGGGAIGGILSIQKLTELDMLSLVAVPAILLGTVDLFGQPIASFILKKFTKKLRTEDAYMLKTMANKNTEVRLTKHGVPFGSEENPSNRITSWIPVSLETEGFVLFEIAAAVALGVFLGDITGFSSVIFAFFIGAIGCALGIFRMNILDRAKSGGFITCVFIAWIMMAMNDVTPESLLSALAPSVSILILAAVGMGIFGGIVGKLLKYDFFLSAAAGVGLMFLMPGVMLVCTEVAKRSSRNEDERKFMYDSMAPSLSIVANVGYIVSVGITVSILLPAMAWF